MVGAKGKVLIIIGVVAGLLLWSHMAKAHDEYGTPGYYGDADQICREITNAEIPEDFGSGNFDCFYPTH